MSNVVSSFVVGCRSLTDQEVEFVAGGWEEGNEFPEGYNPDFSYMTSASQFSSITSMAGFQPDWRDLIPPGIVFVIETLDAMDHEIIVNGSPPPGVDLGNGYTFVAFADGINALYKDGVRIGNVIVDRITLTDADNPEGGVEVGADGVGAQIQDRDGAVWEFRWDPRP